MTFKLKRNLLLPAVLLCAVGLIGCSSADSKPAEKSETKTTEKINNGNVETKTTEKTTVTTEKDKPDKITYESTSDLATAGKDKIGVPECDEYIEKYEACVSAKVPEAARGAMRSSIQQMRQSWKQVAANPQAKAALAGGCKQAQETSKQSMSVYACAW